MRFVLLKRNSPNLRFEWWELDDDNKTIYNQGGGYNFISEEYDEIIEIVEYKSWKKFLTKENLLKTTSYQNLINDSSNKTLKLGWLSPTGKMHYCDYMNYDRYAYDILDASPDELEIKGWIRIHNQMKDSITCGKIMTLAQAKTIKNILGLDVPDENIIYQ